MKYSGIEALVDSKRSRELAEANSKKELLARKQKRRERIAERIANSAYAPSIKRNRTVVDQAIAINGLWKENGYFTYLYNPGYSQHSSVRVGPTLIMGKDSGHNVVANPILRWEAWEGRSDHTAELTFSVVDDKLLEELEAEPLTFHHVFDDNNPDSRREKSYTVNLTSPEHDRLAELAAARAPRFKFSPGLREAIDFSRISRRLTSLEQSMHLLASAVLNDELNPFWANRAKEAGVTDKILGGRQSAPIEELAYKSAYTKQIYRETAQACLVAGELDLLPFFIDTGLVKPEDLQL